MRRRLVRMSARRIPRRNWLTKREVLEEVASLNTIEELAVGDGLSHSGLNLTSTWSLALVLCLLDSALRVGHPFHRHSGSSF